MHQFLNVLKHGFTRVALVIPPVRLADPMANAKEHETLLAQAYRLGVCYAVCPELGLSGYSCGDLFHAQTLIERSLDALGWLTAWSMQWKDMLFSVGIPLVVGDALYNCAVTIQNGKILAVVPKAHPPEYREFYEGRHFARAAEALVKTIDLPGNPAVPFGTDILVQAKDTPAFVLHTEVCEDMWVPVPPSAIAALGGATVLANLSASDITIGKAEYREVLVAVSSGKNNAIQLYCAAGTGESTSDLAWDGDGYIAERGTILARTERFKEGGQLVVQDVDLESLVQDRMRQSSWRQNAVDIVARTGVPRKVHCQHRTEGTAKFDAFRREIDPLPFVPSDAAKRDMRCRETYMIQSTALERRLAGNRNAKVVLGLSGGQDSTLTLLVTLHAFDRLCIPRANIVAVTMPGFGTDGRTYTNACKLARCAGVTLKEMPIRDLTTQTLVAAGALDSPEGIDALVDRIKRDIENSNNGPDDRRLRTAFENAQAWTRKHVLFNISAVGGGMVLGTGDLSELLVGWCTMFGDHASHYNVNAGVPKTLVSFLIGWAAEVIFKDEAELRETLLDILDTEITPGLLPLDDQGNIVQRSQDSTGPYELVDFFGYYTVRWGYRPSRIARMALHAFEDKYDIGTIKMWLRLFLERFFASQYKRNCVPDGPKVGLMSLSPRGDWRMPSDATVAAWLAELDAMIPDALTS